MTTHKENHAPATENMLCQSLLQVIISVSSLDCLSLSCSQHQETDKEVSGKQPNEQSNLQTHNNNRLTGY